MHSGSKGMLIENNLRPRMTVSGGAVCGMNIIDRMRYYGVPNVSIAIVNDGKIEFAKCYGESTSTKPTEAMFQAGSISKFVTAAIVMRLVEDGLLNLEQDVNQILKTYKIPETPFTQFNKITLARLLSHTAGLTVDGFHGYSSLSETTALPSLSQILRGEKPANSARVESNKAPGLTCDYSGGGTQLVQLIIEEVTKKKFCDIARELVFEPLGMSSNSTFDLIWPADVRAKSILPGHLDNGQLIPGGWVMHPESAAAGLWSTATDLARFIIGIQKAYHGDNKKLLSKESAMQMLTLQPNSHFGIGPEINSSASEFSHTGITEGYVCHLLGFTDGQGAVVMTNSTNGFELIAEIMRSIAEVYHWPDSFSLHEVVKKPATIDFESLKKYAGQFEIGSLMKINLSVEDKKLYISLPFPNPTSAITKIELTPESESQFFNIETNIELSFPPENVNELTLVGRYSGTRMPDASQKDEKTLKK